MELVKAKNVKKKFKKEYVLKDINLTCNKSEILVLLGPNGSGKSTILRLLAGVVRKSSGIISVNSKEPINTETRKFLSYLPQKIEFPKSYRVKDMLNFVAEIRKIKKDRINYMVERFSINDWLNKYIGELSGGMLQRLALGITFLPEVDLYLLDEPTNNLDFEGMVAFRKEIEEISKKNSTVILSTHSLIEAEIFSTKVVLLLNGSIISEENSKIFFEKINRMRKLWIRIENINEKTIEILNKECESFKKDFDIIKVSISPDKRFYLLNLLSSNGAIIKEFGLEEPDFEEIYSVFF